MSKVKIQGNKIRVLESYWESDQIAVLLILLIIRYSIVGNSLSVPLKKLAFIMDAAKKNVTVSKLSTLLSSPWEISDNLRKRLILAHEKQYIEIKETSAVVSFSLTEKGKTVIQQIEAQNLFPETRQQLLQLCRGVKQSELKNQHLMW